MALPFVAGLAVGVGAVALFNNRNKVKEAAVDAYEKSKEFAKDSKIFKCCPADNEEKIQKEIDELNAKLEKIKQTKTQETKKETVTKTSVKKDPKKENNA